MGKRKILNKNNSEFIATEILNDLTFKLYSDIFELIATSQFEWLNIPKSMNEDFLEDCLYYNGMASLLEHETLGKINTACVQNGKLNIYNLPTNLNCFSFSFSENRKLYTGLKNDDTSKDSCILVFNNRKRENTFSTMELFSYRLYNATRICDININAQKSPIIISGNDKNLLTLQNFYAKYDGNEPVIFVNKDIVSGNELSTVDTDTKFVAKEIQEIKKEIFNEALTFLGINNINVEKKERLVSDEASSNNELVNFMLQSRLIPRQKAAEQFNELFGTNIQVRVRSDLNNIVKKALSVISDFDEEMEGGTENGNNDNDTLRNN